MSKQPFNIPSLDGLRAVSFLIVFVAHAGWESVVPGGFGVTVFFFLSGFLITTLMRQEYERHRDVSFRQFYLRRVLRILPPFYLVLALATGATLLGLFPDKLSPWSVLAQAGHYVNYWIVSHGYGGIARGTGVYWSLAVEEHFYFLFPMLYVLLRRLGLSGRQQAFVFWGLCAAVLAWRCVLVFALHSPPDRTYLATDTRVDNILFGCALAVYGNPMLDEGAQGPSRLWRWGLLPLGIFALLVSFLVREAHFRESVRYSLQGLALYPIFVVAMREPTFLPFRLLNLSWVKFLGTLSYSLYLVHHVVIFAVGYYLAAVPVVARAVLALALAVGVSWAIYLTVEKPCAKLRKRYATR